SPQTFSAVWQQREGASAEDVPFGVTYDAGGNTYVTGVFTTSIDFGCGAMNATGTSALFVTKLDSSGLCAWSTSISGDGDAGGMSIAVAGDGSIVVGGFFSGTISGQNLTSNGSYDGLLARYTS